MEDSVAWRGAEAEGRREAGSPALEAAAVTVTQASVQEPEGWTMEKISDLDPQIQRLPRFQTIRQSEAKALCTEAKEILVEDSKAQGGLPVTICDDIHGQF